MPMIKFFWASGFPVSFSKQNEFSNRRNSDLDPAHPDEWAFFTFRDGSRFGAQGQAATARRGGQQRRKDRTGAGCAAHSLSFHRSDRDHTDWHSERYTGRRYDCRKTVGLSRTESDPGAV